MEYKKITKILVYVSSLLNQKTLTVIVYNTYYTLVHNSNVFELDCNIPIIHGRIGFAINQCYKNCPSNNYICRCKDTRGIFLDDDAGYNHVYEIVKDDRLNHPNCASIRICTSGWDGVSAVVTLFFDDDYLDVS